MRGNRSRCVISGGVNSIQRADVRGVFAPGCIVLVDDANDDAPRRATRDFVAAHAGAYRVLLDRRTCGNGHPTFWNGVMLLERT